MFFLGNTKTDKKTTKQEICVFVLERERERVAVNCWARYRICIQFLSSKFKDKQFASKIFITFLLFLFIIKCMTFSQKENLRLILVPGR